MGLRARQDCLSVADGWPAEIRSPSQRRFSHREDETASWVCPCTCPPAIVAPRKLGLQPQGMEFWQLIRRFLCCHLVDGAGNGTCQQGSCRAPEGALFLQSPQFGTKVEGETQVRAELDFKSDQTACSREYGKRGRPGSLRHRNFFA